MSNLTSELDKVDSLSRSEIYFKRMDIQSSCMKQRFTFECVDWVEREEGMNLNYDVSRCGGTVFHVVKRVLLVCGCFGYKFNASQVKSRWSLFLKAFISWCMWPVERMDMQPVIVLVLFSVLFKGLWGERVQGWKSISGMRIPSASIYIPSIQWWWFLCCFQMLRLGGIWERQVWARFSFSC